MLRKIPLYIIIVALLLTLDQLSKNYAFYHFQTPIVLLPQLLELVYVKNFGIAFGLQLPQPLIYLSALVLLCFILPMIIREYDTGKKLTIFALLLIVSGALGNIIDRLHQGFVTDFISIWHWPAFNLADAYITTAVLLLIVFYAKLKR